MTTSWRLRRRSISGQPNLAASWQHKANAINDDKRWRQDEPTPCFHCCPIEAKLDCARSASPRLAGLLKPDASGQRGSCTWRSLGSVATPLQVGSKQAALLLGQRGKLDFSRSKVRAGRWMFALGQVARISLLQLGRSGARAKLGSRDTTSGPFGAIFHASLVGV